MKIGKRNEGESSRLDRRQGPSVDRALTLTKVILTVVDILIRLFL